MLAYLLADDLTVRVSTDHRKDTVMLERSNATFCAYSKEKHGKPKKTRMN